MLSNIESARAALNQGAGPPSADALRAAAAASAADCGLLGYSFNATLDCAALGSLPNISFVIGGRGYGVTPQQYVALVGWVIGGWGLWGWRRAQGSAGAGTATGEARARRHAAPRLQAV